MNRRQLVLGTYLPVFLFEVGIGAIMPVVPLSAVAMGATIAEAGVAVALLAVGQIIGDIPAGVVASRLGDRRAMLLAAVASVLLLVVAALTTTLVLLGVALLLIGAINAVFLLARHSYLTEVTPVLYRARALSTLAGLQRIGFFLGPFAGAGLILLFGLGAVYWLAAALSAVCVGVLLAVPDVERQVQPVETVSTWRVLVDHRRLFFTIGVAILLVGAVRGSRQTVIPLWAEHVGLPPATTSVIFGISGAADMLLFYPAGRLMDRRGRLWAAVPSMLLMAVALAVLPQTSTVATITWVAILLGLANGVGSGLVMTIGADVAPPAVRARFLGVWRLYQDTGGAAGPLVVAGGAALGSLAGGVYAMAVIALASAGGLARWAPLWSVHANRTTRRRAREQGLLE